MPETCLGLEQLPVADEMGGHGVTETVQRRRFDSGGDAEGFKAQVRGVMLAARKVGMDPVPLFDAASAMVDRDDVLAREALITSPRE